jgi:hypothetical protein
LANAQSVQVGHAVQCYIRIEARDRDARRRGGGVQPRLGFANVRTAANQFAGQPHRHQKRHLRRTGTGLQFGFQRAWLLRQQQAYGINQRRSLYTERRNACGDRGLLAAGLGHIQRRGDAVAELVDHQHGVACRHLLVALRDIQLSLHAPQLQVVLSQFRQQGQGDAAAVLDRG